VDISGGIQASLSGRYATALFELARDERALDAVSTDLDTVKAAIAESADLRALINSPLIGREDAGKAIAAVAAALGLSSITAKFLGVLAHNHRLIQLPAVIRGFKALAAAHRGETTAEVVSAHPLDAEQLGALKDKLRHRFGRDVAIEARVDKSILGGLIVKMGSQQIDGSIRTKLNSLAHAMKG
jgi:F-type H+-transporting ATPase subunit delta